MNIENNIRHQSHETGYLIASDGRILVSRKGHANRVYLTQAELMKANGCTFTHNHPCGYGPSFSDVALGVHFALKEMRVVTSMFRYGVGMLQPAQHAPLLREFAPQKGKAMQSCTDDVKRGLLNPKDFSHEALHRTWLRLAETLGFDYWKEQS